MGLIDKRKLRKGKSYSEIYGGKKSLEIRQKQLDYLRNKELIAKGYNIIRIWENELINMNLQVFNDIISGGEGFSQWVQ